MFTVITDPAFWIPDWNAAGLDVSDLVSAAYPLAEATAAFAAAARPGTLKVLVRPS